MSLTTHFYQNRVCLNVLAGSKENAGQLRLAAKGYVPIGVLSKKYTSVDSAVAAMRQFAAAT